jgi:predicted O-methyltransferase YrrM
MVGRNLDPAVGEQRSRRFSDDPHGRFWWHHLDGTDYVPAIYQVLTKDEWQLMEEWYATTLAADSIGEINVPAMSIIHGLISGNAIRRVVQLGHYYGYSALLIGFWLRHMGNGGQLVSIDIDPKATAFTQEWIDRAGLSDVVALKLGDSAAQDAVDDSEAKLEGMPQLIILDSSHQYEHTLRELNLWVPRMQRHSLMLLHDTSTYARSWDSGGLGGVQQAVDDWLPSRSDVAFLNLNRHVGDPDKPGDLVYQDGVGLGILQKL